VAIIRINRVPTYNQTENRYEQNIKVLGPSGSLESQLNILETQDVPAISNSMSSSGGGIFVENLTNSIIENKLEYSTSNNFLRNSLCVFYNGLNITNDLVNVSSNSFSLKSDYTGVIVPEDTLLALYTVNNG